MSKLHRILAALLVVQVILAVVVFWPRNTAATGRQPLLGVQDADITGLTITDDQGVTIKLAKQGEAWVLPLAGNFPAEAAKITPVLTKLTGITTARRVAQTAAGHAQLQVAEEKFSRKVELTTAAGTQTLLLGTSAGGQATHVRLAGQDDVYIATGVASWELTAGASAWINTAYVNIPVADLMEFKLRNAAGEWTFSKDAQGAWAQTGGAATDANAVTTLVGQLATLQMTRPVGQVTDDPQYGLTQPAATATLTYASGEAQKTLTLAIGLQDATDGSYAVKSSDSAYVVRVAEFAVGDAVTRTSFAPATPTPAPTAAP